LPQSANLAKQKNSQLWRNFRLAMRTVASSNIALNNFSAGISKLIMP